MKKEASYISIATAFALVGSAASGGLWLGALADDVEELEQAHAQQQEDHDRLIKVETKVEHVEKEVEEIKQTTKQILEIVQQIKREE